MTLRIGNAAGFLGDQIDAPRRLVEAAELDYLTLEYLAELTMSILARAREKNPAAGFAGDFLDVAASLIPHLVRQPKLRIVTNAGGVNPLGCVQAVSRLLVDAGLAELPLGVVSGDDLAGRLNAIQAAGCALANLDTGQPLSELTEPIVSANAYLGARPIVEALAGGARVVITGRVADASLTLGPAVHEFGWAWDDWLRLAGGSVAGHLIECGTQVTGGYYRHWESLQLADVGYPIAEMEEDGQCTITKPAGTGGEVSRHTVAAQLVYEIGDPRHYLTPDVEIDFTTVQIAETSTDRVHVTGATGRPAPETLKVSLAYRAGYTASSQLLVYGRDCLAKGQACAEMIFARLRGAGIDFDRSHVELLGGGDVVAGVTSPPKDLHESMLRISVADSRREAVERFTKEIAPLITSGPPGLAGYATGRSPIRPVFAYWPTLVPRDLISPEVAVKSAAQWLDRKEHQNGTSI